MRGKLMNIFTRLLLIISVSISSFSSAYSHTFGQVYETCYFESFNKQVLLKIKLTTDSGILILKPDVNGDGELSIDELNLLLNKLKDTLFKNIVILKDGQQFEYRIVASDIKPNPLGWIYGVTASFSVVLDGAGNYFFSDNNFLKKGPKDRIEFLIDASLNPAAHLGKHPWELYAQLSPSKSSFPLRSRTFWEYPQKKLIGNLKSQNFEVLFFFVALFLGMVHALSPGHGKTLISAFLVGSKARLKDAFVLSIITAVTHVFSVLVFGLLIFFLEPYLNVKKYYNFIQLLSGVAIVLVGYWMTVRNSKALFGHHHLHHYHSFSPSYKDLLISGITGGIVPCPSAIVILLVSIALKKVLLGLFVIVFFSLGIALTLFLISSLTLLGFKFLEGAFNRFGKLAFLLSPLVVIFVGIAFIVQSVVKLT